MRAYRAAERQSELELLELELPELELPELAGVAAGAAGVGLLEELVESDDELLVEDVLDGVVLLELPRLSVL